MVRILLFFFLVCIIYPAGAQPASPLDRLVSVDARNERLGDVLRQISQQANFGFSYNPAVVNDTRTVTLRLSKQPVRVVLVRLFEGQTVSWKARGNHVLLLGEGETRKEPSHFFLDGYIIDEQTGNRIGAASVYERTSLASTVSNPYGYYRLKLARDLPTNARVEVRKRLYVGESVTLGARQSRTVDVRLRPLPTPPASATVAATNPAPIATRQPPVVADTTPTDLANRAPALPPPSADSTSNPTRRTGWDQTLLSLERVYEVARQIIHRQNLDADTLYRPFQISLLPYIGTNHRLSNHVINHLSVNLFSGTSLGVTGIEIGGFMNHIRGNVQGMQLAGFANFVGHNVYGFQSAGFLNQTQGDVEGGQAAGFMNGVRGNVSGLQLAGFLNRVRGKATHSLQAAGWANKTEGDANRVIQLAGFSNRTRDLRNGLQVAGFINHARVVRRGVQIAPINVADSSGSVPIGLLSFVRQNGFRRFEVSANETFPVNLSYRTGVRRFYNLLTVGAKPADLTGSPVWQAGYGIGTAFGLGRTWLVSVDVSSHAVWNSRTEALFDNWKPALLLRGTPTLEKRFGRLALAAGPSVVFYHLSNATNPLQNTRLLISDNPAVDQLTFSNRNWTSWIGWQAGLRWTN
ncbi:STN and carboxypeptidase regulatory-like domain-containing protein [Rudanella lutea]|uniref:STN and carboxypeptidase regulatory-like domain-containing protein n=1 Tax=Rudanella lutea TaxID=451374 RepID=UPI0003716D14|nr:STN and carboxypeptidase regulatory-like domain-containing protein [Rudanella lutea]